MKDVGYVQYSPKDFAGLINRATHNALVVRNELMHKQFNETKDRIAEQRTWMGLGEPVPLDFVLEEDCENWSEADKAISDRSGFHYYALWSINQKYERFIDMLDKMKYGSQSKALLASDLPVFLNLEVYNAICCLSQEFKFKDVR